LAKAGEVGRAPGECERGTRSIVDASGVGGMSLTSARRGVNDTRGAWVFTGRGMGYEDVKAGASS
ncbi:MAG: hypothetical protein AAFY46_14875, partial [Planctomycetota bacterium]